ncbi:MAG: aminotransferase class V-fold PLP-dependent enzyme [Armatimonadetes bacterium]|nr:aminotransferase class V-fold PLP-dependent enzyme [Armatimonadota bacterium]
MEREDGDRALTPLTEEYVRESIAPYFSRVLEEFRGVYLANHSLGRPLDLVSEDVAEGVSEWFKNLDECWEDSSWPFSMRKFRKNVAALVGAPRHDCVVPKTSAGQGLRSVLNALPLDRPVQVVTTTGEFDSIDFILKTYASKGRAKVKWIGPSANEGPVPLFEASVIASAITSGTDLVVVSSVFFTTGQILSGLDEVVKRAHEVGALVVVDAYHAIGVVPFRMMALDADFLIGGCYKYLRGGPGACYLAIHPRVLDTGLRTLDTGWFAKKDSFAYERPEIPEFEGGGDAWLESTPPVLTSYQANPGLNFTLRIGVAALRAYGLERLAVLREAFLSKGVELFTPSDPDRYGAFALLPHQDAFAVAARMKELGVTVDARGGFVRFGPDILTSTDECRVAARITDQALRGK